MVEVTGGAGGVGRARLFCSRRVRKSCTARGWSASSGSADMSAWNCSGSASHVCGQPPTQPNSFRQSRRDNKRRTTAP